VLPDGPIDKSFDYVVPRQAALRLSARRCGAVARAPCERWIVGVDVSPPAGVTLAEVLAVRGMGPPADVVELATWAAHRWAGRAATILTAASPPTLVSRLPLPLMGTVPMGGEVADLPPEALIGRGAVVRRPPSVDPLPLVLAAARLGPALVVTPTVALRAARRACGAPASASLCCHATGDRPGRGPASRSAPETVWAPVPDLAVVVVIDEHDEALKRNASPLGTPEMSPSSVRGPASRGARVTVPEPRSARVGPARHREPQCRAAGLAGARGGRHAPRR
jgi:primosomal protein N' (replication factor Y)